MFESINYLAVLVATAASIIIGFLWYGPLFGKKWMKLTGLTQKDMEKAKKKGMTGTFTVMIIVSLISTFILAHFLGMAGNLQEGIIMASLIWLGFYATTMTNPVLWENKPWSLWCLNAFYALVILLVQALILTSWV